MYYGVSAISYENSNERKKEKKVLRQNQVVRY